VKGNILIASRDEACRVELLEWLSHEDVTIHSVCEEADLLLEVLERDYDVIIYDLQGAKLDGLKMVRILRKMRPKVALIAFSDDPSTDLGGRVWHEGVVYYAVKPLNLDAIKMAVMGAMRRKN